MELKPCPFCGTTRLVPAMRNQRLVHVSCANAECGAEGPSFYHGLGVRSADEAVYLATKAWNLRHGELRIP